MLSLLHEARSSLHQNGSKLRVVGSGSTDEDLDSIPAANYAEKNGQTKPYRTLTMSWWQKGDALSVPPSHLAVDGRSLWGPEIKRHQKKDDPLSRT